MANGSTDLYYNSLPNPEKKRYEAKLELIFKKQYYSRPYTREKLRAYKSLEEYNYYINGYIQTVLYFCYESNPTVCVLKAKVRASQRATVLHLTWVAVNKRYGRIITGTVPLRESHNIDEEINSADAKYASTSTNSPREVCPNNSVDEKADIQELCNRKFDSIRVTEYQAKNLSELTKEQAESDLWMQHRVGRITQSKMHQDMKCKRKQYPMSLVKSIMQYDTVNPNIPALKWGKDNEDIARQQYSSMMEQSHTNFVMSYH
uniref:YqaJ viral recombinase domain-containing protein n=1 Tax=Amphimedon queenslandica TaxID=400682 RepID=A0A1X7VXI9_AMPQE